MDLAVPGCNPEHTLHLDFFFFLTYSFLSPPSKRKGASIACTCSRPRNTRTSNVSWAVAQKRFKQFPFTFFGGRALSGKLAAEGHRTGQSRARHQLQWLPTTVVPSKSDLCSGRVAKGSSVKKVMEAGTDDRETLLKDNVLTQGSTRRG